MPAAHRSCAFAAAAMLHLHAVAASAPAPLAPPPLLPRRIVDNLANAPLHVECRVRRGPLRNAVLRGVMVLQEDGGCEVVLEDEATPRLEEDEHEHEDIDWPTDRQSIGVRKSLLEGIMD